MNDDAPPTRPAAPAGSEGRDAPEQPQPAERGAGGQTLDRRLFVSLRVATQCTDTAACAVAVARTLESYPDLRAVAYGDWRDPRGVGLLLMGEDPAALLDAGAAVDHHDAWECLKPRFDFSMVGRTYSLGYERDLADTLLHRPLRHALNPDWPWAIWYPLRRGGAFERLPRAEQMEILKEHGTIGMAWGKDDLAHDIRLACHGLDPHDNDFVVGLMGPHLSPLSKLVQRMRSTIQTSAYLERLGPFFVGKALWQSGL